MGAALATFVALAPWLAWMSVGPVLTVLLGVVAIVGAFHGWGRLVARCAHVTDASPSLATVWGIAAVLAIAGALLPLGLYDARLLVISGTALHTIDTGLRYREVGAAIEELFASPRYWLVPVVLGVAAVAVSALAAAGQNTARPFDDETNVIAQVQRLATTGALADPLGLPRTMQLGGHITLGALATAFGDAYLARIVDRGIGLLVFLWLACSLLRPRDGESSIWCALVIVLASSFRSATGDLLPLWIPATLVLGGHVSLATLPATSRALIPVSLVFAALCVMRRELVPVAIVFAIAAAWTGRDFRRISVLVTTFSLAIAGYVIARQLAWAHGGDAHVLAPRSWPLVLELGLFVVIAGAIIPLIVLIAREILDPQRRWLGVALAAAIGGIASRLTGSPPLSTQLLWPVIAASFVVFAAAASGHAALRRLALVLAALGCIQVVETQTAEHRGWAVRAREMAWDIAYARDRAPLADAYAQMLATVPRGDRIAVWVARPELLDASAHDVVDLRTPMAARSGNMKALVRASRARWLLVEGNEPPVAGLAEMGHVTLDRGGLVLVEAPR